MRLSKRIIELTELLHRDERDNIVLTIFWNSLYLAFFLLPLGINLSTPFFIVSIILGVVNIFKSQKKFFLYNKALLLFPVYFIVLSLSLVYTDNLSDGIELVQRSLSLLLFPIIFLFVKEDALTVRKLFNFLLLGLIVSFFINFAIAIHDSVLFVKGDDSIELTSISSLIETLILVWNFFIGAEFSVLVNPSYVSVYILLVLSYFLKKELITGIRFFIVTLLFLYLFLLASLAAYLILFMMSVLLIFAVKDTSKRYLMLIIFFLGLIVFLNNPRVFDFYSRVKSYENTTSYDHTASEKSRILTWQASLQLIKEAPFFGYGVGDANDVLIEKYKELGYIYNYQNRYNAHNQFLQTLLHTGIIGLGILVFIFVLLALRMKRSSNELAVLLILFISLMFESMLVRFNGIVFFSIVIPLLLKKRSILGSRIIRNNGIN
ncbi:hypothetical protein GCM10022393_06610 [Aquimarina addita]|uniref:O-antigen ligase-related domain-containing protein n=1 Tax=Aquimarina addita TaxID=870485 RepID=A0ABP7XBI7_9FLAO